MSYQCVQSGCTNEAIFDTNVCEDCLIKLHHKNLENFGIPEYYICGSCGDKFTDFQAHAELHRSTELVEQRIIKED